MELDINSIQKIYFIGIGGIGMSAIARYMSALGKEIHGYDKTKTSLTKKLEDEGMTIHYEDRPELVPTDVDVVVYTPAIPESLKELIEVRDRGCIVMKRSEMLGVISRSKETVAIAGTHGKTTTSAITAHLLKTCGIDISAFVGGIMTNYESNYIGGKDNWVVCEADEYDRSFLRLAPDIAALTSMDADHLDIYGGHDEMKTTFGDFLSNVSEGGSLIIEESLIQDISEAVLDAIRDKDVEIITYGYESGDAQVSDVRVEEGVFRFTYRWGSRVMKDLVSHLPGKHNIKNACAAITIALLLEGGEDDIREGMESFKGIKRRFEKIVDGTQMYYDDYAHHPSELEAAISAVKMLHPDRKVTGIFQPHLYSRTKDFAEGFAKELDRLDKVILMDIYPAREEKIPGVDSDLIKRYMNNEHVVRVSKENLMEHVDKNEIEVLMTLGAGDIDVFVAQIKDLMEHD